MKFLDLPLHSIWNRAVGGVGCVKWYRFSDCCRLAGHAEMEIEAGGATRNGLDLSQPVPSGSVWGG